MSDSAAQRLNGEARGKLPCRDDVGGLVESGVPAACGQPRVMSDVIALNA